MIRKPDFDPYSAGFNGKPPQPAVPYYGRYKKMKKQKRCQDFRFESLGVLFPAACGDKKEIVLYKDTPSACGGIVYLYLIFKCLAGRESVREHAGGIYCKETVKVLIEQD